MKSLDREMTVFAGAVTMGAKKDYMTGFFLFRPSISVKITRILQKTPNSGKMAIMIFLSELILAFFGLKQRERRGEKREERRRCGLRCNVLSRAVLSCAVDNCIYICCSKAVTFHNVFLCVM